MPDRREQILKLTCRFIKKVGYDGFSYNDLSKELGVTKASIHYHFPKKEDLGLAFCEWLLEWAQKTFEHIRAEALSPKERLIRFVELNAGVAGEHGCICPAFSLQSELNLITQEMRQVLERLNEVEIKFLAESLEEGREYGEICFKGNPRTQALIVCAALKGGVQYARLHGCKEYEAIKNQLLAGLIA